MCPLLEVNNIRKVYRHQGLPVEALKGLSLQLDSGQVLGFLGENGAGKTTAIKVISGLVTPDEGSVLIEGRDPITSSECLRRVGIVLEGGRSLYGRLTPLENIEYFATLKGVKRKRALEQGIRLLKRFDLMHKSDTQIQALSRGMQQKVSIAVAIVHEPILVLMDEPTLGVDVQATEEIKQIVKDIVDDGCSVLLTTHQLDLAEQLSNRIAIVKDGRVLLDDSVDNITRRFSADSYVIDYQGSLPDSVEKLLVSSGSVIEQERVLLRGTPENLYHVLELIRPAPLIRVERDNSSLTDVFSTLLNSKPTAKCYDV